MSTFPRSILFLTLSLPIIMFPYSSVYARWAEESEADIECISQKVSYTVKKDGTWEAKMDTRLKVLTEAGREALSKQCIEYDATRNIFKVLKASTKNNGTKFIVPEKRIEDKPLASDPLGLSKKHQVLIPFEQVIVGSTLHLIKENHHINPDFEKHFSLNFGFNDGLLRKKLRLPLSLNCRFFQKSMIRGIV